MIETRRAAVLDSTNAEAARLAAAGETGPLWILAERQTAGRGRRGREWVSGPGNLYATLLMPLPVPLERCAELSFAAALAAAGLAVSFASGVSVQFKWPNDVLLGGGKVGGILLETLAGSCLAVGIGVNLAHHPENTEFPAASLAAAAGQAPDIELAHARLAAGWDKWYDIWREKGFAPLREAWLARAAGLGGKMTVHLGESEIEGVFEDLDQDGALLLRRTGGMRARISAGDVYFGTQ